MSPLTNVSKPWRALTTIIICALRERTSGLKDQEPQCYRSSGVLLIELTLIMLKGCGKNLLSLLHNLQKTRGILAQHAQGIKIDYHSDPNTGNLITETSTTQLKVPGKGNREVETYSRPSVQRHIEESFPPFMLNCGLYGSDTILRKKCVQSFGDQFLNDKPSEADNEKTTADTEAESMPCLDPYSPNVHWPIANYHNPTAAQTTTSSIPPQPQQGPSNPIIIKRMGELEEFIANPVEQTVEFINLQEIDQKINGSVKEVVISSVKHAMRAPLRARFKDLPMSDMKEILLQRMLEENYDKGHANHRVAYKALQDSTRHDESEDFDVDKAQEETKKKSKQDSPNTPPGSPPSPPPPPPPPSGASGASGITGASNSAQDPHPPPSSSSTHQGDQSTSTAAPSSLKTAASAEYSAWTTTDTRIKPLITTIPDDLYMDDETTADEQAYSSGDEVRRDHIPTLNLRQ
ncbi:hypothetical protein Tco_0287020 [Tanacetum coccineum]